MHWLTQMILELRGSITEPSQLPTNKLVARYLMKVAPGLRHIKKSMGFPLGASLRPLFTSSPSWGVPQRPFSNFPGFLLGPPEGSSWVSLGPTWVPSGSPVHPPGPSLGSHWVDRSLLPFSGFPLGASSGVSPLGAALGPPSSF